MRARGQYARGAEAIAQAQAAADAFPEVEWDDWLAHLCAYWQQGEHMTALGHTGGGKTTALVQTLDGSRRYVVALLTKRRDELFGTLRGRGWRMIRNLDEWNERPSDWRPGRLAIHLPPTGLSGSDAKEQAEKVRRVIHDVWDTGNLTLYIDEISALGDTMGLNAELRNLWKEARSSNVSIVAGTQRPARIPLEAYSQPRYLLLWRTNDRDQLKRLADMNAVDPEPVRIAIRSLRKHEILVVDTADQVTFRTMAPKLK